MRVDIVHTAAVYLRLSKFCAAAADAVMECTVFGHFCCWYAYVGPRQLDQPVEPLLLQAECYNTRQTEGVSPIF